MFKIQKQSEQGITLISLVVYIIILVLVMGIMTTISTFFFDSVIDAINTPTYISEFNKFVMFFVIDIKDYSEAIVTDNMIEFEGGPIYKFENGCIYRDDLEIATYILDCTFTAKKYNVNLITKNLINVNIQVGKDNDDSITQNIDFTLKYW